MSENVEVAVPGGTVYLIPTISVPMAMAAMQAFRDSPANIASMTGAFVAVALHAAPVGAIAGWTLHEDSDKGIPELVEVNDANIERLLSWTKGGKEVAEKCSELYTADLFAPFASELKKLSRRGPTDHLTSQTPPSGSKHPKRSKRSSPNGEAGMRSVVPAP